MAKEVAKLKEEAEMLKRSNLRWVILQMNILCAKCLLYCFVLPWHLCLLNGVDCSDCPQAMSPGARNSRIFALENMLATSSSTLVSMASQLSEAEERERGFSGRGRWNQVRSLADAKNLMNHLFYLASSYRYFGQRFPQNRILV